MIRHLLKPLSFIPAILMMYLIFSFSAQDGETSAQLSYKVSYKIVEIGAEILDADFETWEIENLAVRFQGPIRKIAHMTEYCILAICVSFPLYVYGLRGIWLMLVAGFLCVGFACTDEYHQAFVDGRGPSRKDVLIDSVGVFAGIILVRIIGWIGRKTIFRPFNRKKHKQEQVPAYASQPNYAFYPPSQGQYSPGQYPPQGSSEYPPPQGQYSPQREYPPQSHYPPPYTGQSGAYSQDCYYGQPQNYYAGKPAGYPQDSEDDEDDDYISDQLSEDMSFKKLMHDLREKRKN